MAPNILDPVTKKPEKESSDVRCRLDGTQKHLPSKLTAEEPQQKATEFKPQIRWPDLIAQVFIHLGSLYGLFYLFTLKAKLYTYIWCKSLVSNCFRELHENRFFFTVIFLIYASGIGITAGQLARRYCKAHINFKCPFYLHMQVRTAFGLTNRTKQSGLCVFYSFSFLRLPAR